MFCRTMLIGIAVVLGSGSSMASELEVEFCATIATPRITLGTHSRIMYYLWNKTTKPIEYATPPVPVPVHHFDVAGKRHPPTFSTLDPGDFTLLVTPVPMGGGFSVEMVGEYNIPVSVQVRIGSGIQTLEQAVRYELVDQPPPDRYVVKKKRQRSKQLSNEVTTVFVLDDSLYREERKRARSSIMAGRSQDDVENYLEGKRQWYDTPYGHQGFGERDDWIHETGPNSGFALINDLDCLLEGSYRLTELDYRIRYGVQFEARKIYGLSPYFAVKHSLYLFREQGKATALEYLDGLDPSGWNCVDRAIRAYVREQIAGWSKTSRPEGLVYTKELRKKLLPGGDGRLYRIDSPSDTPL